MRSGGEYAFLPLSDRPSVRQYADGEAMDKLAAGSIRMTRGGGGGG